MMQIPDHAMYTPILFMDNTLLPGSLGNRDEQLKPFIALKNHKSLNAFVDDFAPKMTCQN